ncbi:MAG: UDP-N-acetylglucosamine--LPS N-acetylglucosamine transferase [Rhodocyclaceae bacterium]|nr:UDP-N-acetylglucosamine--LPS N-acetylglucosamine transferase [Rhodocyclaceae bacterium]
MGKRIVAVASGGGHWVQLRRLQAAFAGHDVAYATVQDEYRSDVPTGARFYLIRDATRWDRLGLVVLAFQLLAIMVRERPHVVVSTGAAPGYFALRLGKLFGARIAWIDSLANVEEVSLSGRMIGPNSDLWLTQWPHLARDEGPHYKGAVF